MAIYESKLPIYALLENTTSAPKQEAEYDVFSLSAWPNPINNTSILGHSITKTTHINLSVFDISRKHIKTILNKTQDASKYQIQLPVLGRGCYFCKIANGLGYFETIKIIKE